MTASERRRDALKFLAVARRADADPALAVVYQTALADVDPAWLERACHHLANAPREPYESAMPDVGTLRALAERMAREASETARMKALPPAPVRQDDEPRFFCPDCLDEASGWTSAWCPGYGALRVSVDDKPERSARLPISLCGRTLRHGPHELAIRCHCWGHNPVVEERRRREVRRVEERKAKAS